MLILIRYAPRKLVLHNIIWSHFQFHSNYMPYLLPDGCLWLESCCPFNSALKKSLLLTCVTKLRSQMSAAVLFAMLPIDGRWQLQVVWMSAEKRCFTELVILAWLDTHTPTMNNWIVFAHSKTVEMHNIYYYMTIAVFWCRKRLLSRCNLF